MANGHQADANLGQIRVEGILCRNLIHLKSRQLERFLRDFVDTALSTFSFNIDVQLSWGVVFCQGKFTIGIASMIKSENLFPGKLVVETKFLVEETSTDILVVARDGQSANAELGVFLIWLELCNRCTCNN